MKPITVDESEIGYMTHETKQQIVSHNEGWSVACEANP